MTANQLIDAIRGNFKGDEEVTFLYNDDQGEVRSADAAVREHTEQRCEGHWEVRADGQWVRTDKDTAYRAPREDCRFVIDRQWEDTRKVVEIR